MYLLSGRDVNFFNATAILNFLLSAYWRLRLQTEMTSKSHFLNRNFVVSKLAITMMIGTSQPYSLNFSFDSFNWRCWQCSHPSYLSQHKKQISIPINGLLHNLMVIVDKNSQRFSIQRFAMEHGMEHSAKLWSQLDIALAPYSLTSLQFWNEWHRSPLSHNQTLLLFPRYYV